MAKQTKGEVKIEGQNQYFKADFIILPGLFKTQVRNNLKENIKRFSIKPVKAQDKNSMGIRFHELGNATIIHVDMPGSSNQQILVSIDLELKELNGLPMNETYKKLIRHAHELAGGKPIGIIRKLKNAIK